MTQGMWFSIGAAICYGIAVAFADRFIKGVATTAAVLLTFTWLGRIACVFAAKLGVSQP